MSTFATLTTFRPEKNWVYWCNYCIVYNYCNYCILQLYNNIAIVSVAIISIILQLTIAIIIHDLPQIRMAVASRNKGLRESYFFAGLESGEDDP